MQDNKALTDAINHWVGGWASARNIDEAGTAIGKAARDVGNFIGRNIRSLFGGGSKSSGPPPNMSSYVSFNNASFAGAQMGMGNLNSSLTHDVYRITPTYSWDLNSTDWEKVTGKTSEIGTSTALLTSGLEIGGMASPFMKGFGTYAGNIGTLAQASGNTLKVLKDEKDGGISPQRYGYRMVGTGVSWGLTYAIGQWGVGGAYAGPYGVLAVVIFGAGFQGLEYSYDIIAPQIQSSYNGFVNNLYNASYNAQFSGR